MKLSFKIFHGHFLLKSSQEVCPVKNPGGFAVETKSKIRIFNDENGKMNKSVLDIGGEALVVSQFTLAADTSRGNRPGFSYAASPDEGRRLYEKFVEELKKLGVKSKKGRFGENMKVSLINDGPTTIWLDSKN